MISSRLMTVLDGTEDSNSVHGISSGIFLSKVNIKFSALQKVLENQQGECAHGIFIV